MGNKVCNNTHFFFVRLLSECKLQVFLLSRDHTLLEGTVNLVIFFFRGHCTDHLPLLVLQQPFLCLPSVSLCIFPRVFLSPLAIYPTYPLSPVNTSKLSTRCLLRIRVVALSESLICWFLILSILISSKENFKIFFFLSTNSSSAFCDPVSAINHRKSHLFCLKVWLNSCCSRLSIASKQVL